MAKDNSVKKTGSGKTAKADATKGLENLDDMKKALEESTKVDPKKCQDALKKLAEASHANKQTQEGVTYRAPIFVSYEHYL